MSDSIITESVQQFNLRWTNYSSNLMEVLVDKFNKGILTDVTLCCEGTLIRAHKMVLAASSTFFEHLFDTYNESNPLIILNGVPLSELKMLIQFMYRGEIIVREDEVQGILKLSHELQIKGLSEAKFNSMFPQSMNMPVKETEKTSKEDSVPVNDRKSSQMELNLEQDVKDVSTRLKPLPGKMSVPNNAFRQYMKIMQKKLSAIHPSESPSDISERVVMLWTNLSYDEKINFYKNTKWDVGVSDASPTWSTSKDSGANANTSSKRKRNIGIVRIIPQANISTAKSSSTIEIDDDIELIEDDSDPRIDKEKNHENS